MAPVLISWSILPKILKPVRGQIRVPRRVLDVAMPEVLLNRSRVVAVVGQFVAGRTAEHVRMNRELKAGLACGPGDDLSNRVRGSTEPCAR